MTTTSLYACFQERVRMHPERTAIIAPDGTRSYAELDAEVASLATLLAEHGIGRGGRVGLLLSRGRGAVTAMLALYRLGACFVPLDPSFPAARLNAMLSDSDPALVLIQEEHRELIREYRGAVLPLPEVLEARQQTAGVATVAAHDPMYIIYTSGTTGKPKGIVQTFGMLEHLIAWQNRDSQIEAGGRVLQNASLCFDVCLQEVFAPLTQGGVASSVATKRRSTRISC
ncbi:hypothetical protein CAI21_13595 [Alkalilimnicola ehrlichii]|uniref:AMP-dependent synthetase/ligase domain-containing protein n=1 Tax=Alkalilimnicola ehrlichii TaxID=351052 RepID=A0A3E0WRJ3_9GAMM|nr:AMP-binding protein [Alkalilimnicola ehrlichii]RFA27951.1 hypothetical protein CAI21_13595 [Alkalilimnicola ehrlichii]RFA34595.1 hypothetical protein CAL65_14615 [Alkalilimnicola ehrlichii]